jgi:hypothetical protein
MSIGHAKEWCRSGLRTNQKYFILIKSGNLWIVGPNALKGRVIT